MARARRPVLMLVSSSRAETVVLECGRALAQAQGLPSRVLAAASPEVLETTVQAGGLAAARVQGPPEPGISVLVTDFSPGSQAFGSLLRATLDWGVPGVFVRGREGLSCTRVLVPTSGGHHTMRQMWVADALARTFGVPAEILRVVSSEGSGGEARQPPAPAELQMRSVGLTGRVRRDHDADPVAGICRQVRSGDLLVVGAPNAWRAATHFAGSVPDLLAQRLGNPLAMVVAPPPRVLALRDVLWESLVRLDLRAADGRAVIEVLVDTLVRTHQLPPACRDDALRRALSREAERPTAVGSGVAFPHIALPGFRGVLCCLGICAEAVRFGDDVPEPVRLVVLFVTSDEAYDDYLTVLGLVARRLSLAAVRSGLLSCVTAKAAIDLLAPPLAVPPPSGVAEWPPGGAWCPRRARRRRQEARQ